MKRMAICAGVLLAASGNSAAAAALVSGGEVPPTDSRETAHYDPRLRVLYLGAPNQNLPGPVPEITAARTANLVGRPLRQLVTIVPRWSGSAGGGAIPTSLPFSPRAITSSFGLRAHPILGGWRQHSGIDLAAASGTPIAATTDGLVTGANWTGGYGLLVSMDDGRGIQTRYGHMSRLNVVAGQHVRRGDVIGFVGSTGLSTGPHLHYEVRVNGRAVDPVSRDLRR